MIGTAEKVPVSVDGKTISAVWFCLAAVVAIGRRVNAPLSSRRTGVCVGSDDGGIRSAVGGMQESGTAAIGSKGLAEEGFNDEAMAVELEIGGTKRKRRERKPG